MNPWLAGLGAGLQSAGQSAMQLLAQEQARKEREAERARQQKLQDDALARANRQFEQQVAQFAFQNNLTPYEQAEAPIKQAETIGSTLSSFRDTPMFGMGLASAGDALSEIAKKSRAQMARGRTLEMPMADGTTRKYLQPYEKTPEGLAEQERKRSRQALVSAGFSEQEADAVLNSPEKMQSAILERIRPKPKDAPAPREVVRPDGSVVYVQPPEIEPGQTWDSGLKQRVPASPTPKPSYDLDPTVVARADKLRSQYENNPYVKNAAVIASQLSVMEGANQRPDAAGDLAMIFGYMKILDPGSVVREGEFANAQNAAGVPDMVRNAYNRALQGTRLNPQQRQQFLTQGRNIANQTRQQLQQQNARFSKIATQYQVDPALVVYDPFEVLDMAGGQGGAGKPPSVRDY